MFAADGSRVVTSPLVIPGVWRGERQREAIPTESTGIRQLDDLLLGGWPKASLTQLVSSDDGFGLSVLLPTLAKLTQAGRPIAFVQPPHQPCAPALVSQGLDIKQLLWVQTKNTTQALWAFEQLLRGGLHAAVVYWGSAMDCTTERRLQLAAETGKGLAFCFRTGGEDSHSYAAARLSLKPEGQGSADLGIQVLKCRGVRAGRRVRHVGYSPVPLLRDPRI